MGTSCRKRATTISKLSQLLSCTWDLVIFPKHAYARDGCLKFAKTVWADVQLPRKNEAKPRLRCLDIRTQSEWLNTKVLHIQATTINSGISSDQILGQICHDLKQIWINCLKMRTSFCMSPKNFCAGASIVCLAGYIFVEWFESGKAAIVHSLFVRPDLLNF